MSETTDAAGTTGFDAREPVKIVVTDFLQGGGELGSLLRAFNWKENLLGPPANWPQSLKTAVRIMLTSRQPIWIGWGKSLIYLYNDPYKSIIGGKHPWALGRATSEVWSEIWSDIGPMLATAMGGIEGTYVEEQLLIMERSGYPEETYYTFSYSPIPDDDGTPGGIICANTDDTERVIGERQLALLRELAANTTDARTPSAVCERSASVLASNARDLPFALIYMSDPNGSSVTLQGTSGINAGHAAAPAKIELGGPSPWPVEGALHASEIHLVENLSEIAKEFPTGAWNQPPSKAAIIPIAASGPQGTPGVLIVGLNPFRKLDDVYRGFLKLVAGQISAAVANAEAYEAERKRAEMLAELDQAKTLFFSNVSHEFRTPLTLMLGPLEEALAHGDALEARSRDLVSVAHRNGLRLLKLVNSLLDFSRIEAGRAKANFEPTDLATFTAELASNFRSVTEKAGLRLVVDCEPLAQPVYVDREMWEKIVLNLISNAFKFTFDGEISVSLKASSDHVELTVRDTGTGIPESELPRLFERFHRIEGARGRSFEGSGIGLALVLELAKLHSGNIRVESVEGKGSSFIVSIPFGKKGGGTAASAERPGASTAVRARAFVEEASRWLPGVEEPGVSVAESFADNEPINIQSAERARILLADDNADMREYVRRLLGAAHDVEVANDGEVALALVRQQRPDLVLTDVMMPKLDGFGLIRAIRQDSELRDLPVIVLSARAGPEASVEGLSAGADDYLVKPFTARELVARVDSALAMSKLRRQMNEALRESEARFRNMADNAPVMIWTTDPSGSCTYLSKSWYEFTGQTPETGLGFGWLDATHPEDKEPASEVFLAANSRHQPFSLEYRLRRQDGIYRWAIDAATPWFGNDGEFLGYIGSVIDITERKETEEAQRALNQTLEKRVAEELSLRLKAEEDLHQAQKMEAIGQLTGGVAHDFNNLLTIVMGNLESMQRHFPAGTPDRLRRSAENAMQGAKRAATLTQRLLAFSRRQPLVPKPTEPNRLIAGMSEMLSRTLGESIEVQTVLGGGLWRIEVDPNQLESTILNLAVNARDAMPGGGRLTIETANAHLDELYAAREAEVVPGQYVVIAVSDTGAGMSKEVMSRVFEPFFTTKPTGHGTGLGLSQVYGFVKQSGGHVKLYSEPKHGTTVKIYLPRFTGTSAEPEQEVQATIPDGHRGETILLVEDEDGVRGHASDILRELGYSVVEAPDANGALRYLERGNTVSLLLTDVGLPGLNGRQLADAARKHQPMLKVLYMTGYARNAIVHHGRLDAGVEMISKPFTFAGLAAKVRSVLDKE